jgi:2-iminobutanoate/2-iminopropanoate deaminase
MIEHIRAGATSHLPFSSAVIANGFVFVSGQASVDPQTGAVVSDTFDGEMRRAFANLGLVLAEVGCKLSDLVSVRCYVDDQHRLEEYNRLYGTLFPPPYPARTTLIGVLGRDFLKFEVDAIAYRTTP